MIKGIIFDWAGTCATEGEPLIAPVLGVKTGLKLEDLNVLTSDIYKKYATGAFSTDLFWEKVLEKFNLQNDPNIRIADLSAAYRASTKPFRGVLNIARDLRNRGIVTSLLSNITLEMRDHLQNTVALKDYFDYETYSCDFDVLDVKPNPKPYRIALKKMNLKGPETLFIDDSRSNLKGAQKFGIQTLLFTTPEQFLKDMRIIYTKL